jgi:DNA-binding transcriptional LysR family regulator
MDMLRAMSAFVCVVQEGTMSAAAAKLKLSPALIGQRIAALEGKLGTRLLHRTTRSQSLTDFGTRYYDQCCDILERMALAESQADELRTSLRGKLRITAPLTFGTISLVPALKKFRAIAPEVKINLVLSDVSLDFVDDGFDAAFRIGVIPDSRLIARKLTPYQMMICAAPAYLAQAGLPSHPAQLSSYEAIGFTPSAHATWRLSRGTERVEVEPTCHLSVNCGEALRRAASSGMGLIMQPATLLAPDIASGALVQLFPDWQIRQRPMSLLYYRDPHMPQRLRCFIAFALEEFGQR